MSKLDFKYDVDQRPSSKKESVFLAIQHVFAMFGSTILVPTLIGLDPSVSLVSAGLGTLIYSFFTKSKVPVFIGSSFAYIGLLTALNQSGDKSQIGLAVMCVGVLYMLIAVLIKLTGSGWVNKILPPVVIGPVIVVIGLSLAPVAIANAGISADNFNLNSAIISFVSFFVTCISLLVGRDFNKSIPVILGIASGYITALFLNEVDTSLIFNTPLFVIPDFNILFVDYQFKFDPSVLAAVIPLVLVTLSEHIGDHKVSSAITGRDFIKDPGLHRTIFGDGFATFVAGILGAPVNTTYAENTGVIILTRVASTYVIKLAAIFAIFLAFVGPLVGIINSIPISVMGGISIILFGLIAQNGMRIIKDNNVDLASSRNMIIMGTILVVGLGGAVVSFSLFTIDFEFSYMSLAAIVGVLLNLVLPKEKR